MISNANDGRRLKQKGPRCLLPVLFVLVVTMVTAVVMMMVVEVKGNQRLVVERRQQGLLVVLGEWSRRFGRSIHHDQTNC
jgi:hypothetical protein